MRWYRKWYNDGWQEVDEDHIRDTDCTDPYDGKEHNIAQVSIEAEAVISWLYNINISLS